MRDAIMGGARSHEFADDRLEFAVVVAADSGFLMQRLERNLLFNLLAQHWRAGSEIRPLPQQR